MKPRRFEMSDQLAFAALSGDFNPVHVDPLAARRTQFGRPIVHGVHALCWALDRYLAEFRPTGGVQRVRVRFTRAIGVGDDVTCAARTADGSVRLDLTALATPAARVRVWLGEALEPSMPVAASAPEATPCRERALGDLAGLSGTLPLHLPDAARSRFPTLAAQLGDARLAALLATTRLVGMECPGLHSLYSELDVALAGNGVERPELGWNVAKLDARFSLVELEGRAPGFSARIRAMVRPRPALQPTFSEISTRVGAGEFAGQRALVVGGSRGIGEVATKLLAAGGADVLVSYRRGRDDAERVVAELRGGGVAAGSIGSIELDVTQQDAARQLPEGWNPTHLYYFATPPILSGSFGRFRTSIFDSFARVYVMALAELVDGLAGRSRDLEALFYPSSVFVDERPKGFAEYIVAKCAGESLCDALAQLHAIRVARPRLPRIATDQTSSLTPVEVADPVPLLLPELRGLA